MGADEVETGWTVVVPVKQADLAKSRLAPALGVFRSRLAHAFALDTVDTVVACERVSRVVVVTDDDVLVRALPRGVDVVGDPTGGDDLDAAVLAGAHVAHGPVASVAADLPALVVDELTEALDAAAHHVRAVVADADGTGTTMLTARGGALLRPAYGPGSAARHVALGAVALDGAWPGLRRDVDEAAHVAALRPADVGRRTAAVLRLIP
ncbi:2-phospho-L-lactate guanylyltransferase [Solicola sp. PLA-1-18]|uniref:2-phospho-L-lactate guanylyltransferase n=1 Tax=Solicola sp. PLA-1-18 TaxID=3380532 RepID=UPI003B7B6343